MDIALHFRFAYGTGLALPAGDRTRFTIDWRCPHCKSPNVAIDPLDQRELRYCDGGPSTEDGMRYWICNTCAARTLGRYMKAKYKKIEISVEELLEERLGENEGMQKLAEMLECLASQKPKDPVKE